jgi:hypothetical protein
MDRWASSGRPHKTNLSPLFSRVGVPNMPKTAEIRPSLDPQWQNSSIIRHFVAFFGLYFSMKRL